MTPASVLAAVVDVIMLHADLVSQYGTSPLWVVVAALYIASAIYFDAFDPRYIPRPITMAFFAVGAAIFIAVNRRWVVGDHELFLLLTELVIIGLLLWAWYLTTLTVARAPGFPPERARYDPDPADPDPDD